MAQPHRAEKVLFAPESALVESARSGGESLAYLIAAVWPEAYRIAVNILHDRGLAEDVAQDACAAIASSLPALKNTDAFRAWSYKIILRHAITAARRRPREQTLDALTDRRIHFDRSEALDLYNALAALPVVQRGAIILHYYAGLDSAEIAAATGLPRSTVRFHLMLARRRLRNALSAPEARTQPSSNEVVSDVH